MGGGVVGERDVLGRGFPGLLEAADPGGWTLGVGHDATTGGVHEINGAEGGEGSGGLLCGLAGGEDRHDLAAWVGRGEHGREALAGGGDDGVVGLTELVAEAVDVGVVDASKTPELLEGDEAHADGRGASEHAPAVAVAVDGEL